MEKENDINKALFEAIDEGNVEAVKSAIAAGADVNAKDEDGCTPLHGCRDADIVKALIDAGADVNAKDEDGCTPLHGCRDADIAKALINAGADVNAINKRGNSPLFNIRFSRGFDHSGISEIVDILIDAGADLTLFNLTNDFGDLNVHIGAYNCTPKIMKVLINAGASEYFDSDKDNTCSEYSPLHGCNNLEVAKMLVENYIDVNTVTMNWETPLDTITNEDVIKYLKEYGAVYGEELDDEDE